MYKWWLWSTLNHFTATEKVVVVGLGFLIQWILLLFCLTSMWSDIILFMVVFSLCNRIWVLAGVLVCGMRNPHDGGKGLYLLGDQQEWHTGRSGHSGDSSSCAFSCFFIWLSLGLASKVHSDRKCKCYICFGFYFHRFGYSTCCCPQRLVLWLIYW